MFIITNILVLFQFYYINYCIFEIVAVNFLLKNKNESKSNINLFILKIIVNTYFYY